MRNSGEASNYGRIIGAIFDQRQKVFVLNLTTRSFSNHQQLLVKLRVREVYLFQEILTTTNSSWNFNVVYASHIARE
jgi:hypothetical protein